MNEGDHQIIPEGRLDSQQFIADHRARDEHELDISDGQTAELIEVKQMKDEVYLIFERDYLREQGHRWEQFQPIDQQIVGSIEELEYRMQLSKDLLEFHIVDGCECFARVPIGCVEFLDFGERVVAEELSFGEVLPFVEHLGEHLTHCF